MTAKKTPAPVEQKDELLALLDEALHAYVVTKRRYPLLVATTKSIDTLLERLRVQNTSPRKPGIWNDAVLQLLRDSFDVFVIDLASIRERLVEKNGLLSQLKKECARLRRCEPAEIEAQPVMLSGDMRGADPGRIEAEFQQHVRERIAGSINASLSRLIPDEYPVTAKGVEALIKRFMKDTEPVERDRNHVRAHRYEYRGFDRRKHFQPLDELQGQLDIFEQLLGDLFHVLTRGTFGFKLRFTASTEGTAEDLADLMVHGSINGAVNAYSVAQQTPENPVPWYYARRSRFFESQPGTGEGNKEG
ncbi:hypothetical protein [Myxococcus sp. RHSTA-1-4]|uniref:hypothetical protein n=1 Tax=Myxococcus sp. RHSTA-1-4 TaxID=2874601 RepID=UPI001CC1A6C7|nr:hypothetical protein [Myxococcus sp. RHSTA-1-4]MBZ4421760.1 hypothetical protein [Myxococcus sp. RHSTA-1-4]